MPRKSPGICTCTAAGRWRWPSRRSWHRRHARQPRVRSSEGRQRLDRMPKRLSIERKRVESARVTVERAPPGRFSHRRAYGLVRNVSVAGARGATTARAWMPGTDASDRAPDPSAPPYQSAGADLRGTAPGSALGRRGQRLGATTTQPSPSANTEAQPAPDSRPNSASSCAATTASVTPHAASCSSQPGSPRTTPS